MVTEKISNLLDQYFDLGVESGWEGNSEVTARAEEVRCKIEAALSTDAEPVLEIVEATSPLVREALGNDIKALINLRTLPVGTKLYAAPPAPSVAVKALERLDKLRAAIGDTHDSGLVGLNKLAGWARDIDEILSALSAQVQDVARPLSEYHEDSGPVVWWKFPVEEPSYIGCPNSSDWPGYHTHWTPHPAIPTAPAAKLGEKP